MPKRGAYVSIDGPDGVGKSFQAGKLASATDSMAVREPGGYTSDIRAIVVGKVVELTPEAEVLLFSADRNLTLRMVTEPAIRRGTSVVSDRSFLSTLAYQCYGRGLNLDFAKAATKLALGDFRADRIVILDAPYEVTAQRLQERRPGVGGINPEADRFESEDKFFQDRVRNGFLELVREIGDRAVLVDGSGTREEVSKEIYAQTGALLLDRISIDD